MDEPTTITAHFKLQPTRCVLINAVKHRAGTRGIDHVSVFVPDFGKIVV